MRKLYVFLSFFNFHIESYAFIFFFFNEVLFKSLKLISSDRKRINLVNLDKIS